MRLGGKVAEFCKHLDLTARIPSSLDFLLQFLSLSVYECPEDEFWTSLNSQRTLRPNLLSFPFSAQLKKETVFSFLKSSIAVPGASSAALSFYLIDLSIQNLPASLIFANFTPFKPI